MLSLWRRGDLSPGGWDVIILICLALLLGQSAHLREGLPLAMRGVMGGGFPGSEDSRIDYTVELAFNLL